MPPILPSVTEMTSGWGRFPQVRCRTYRPERRRDLPALLASDAPPLIAHGQGRSYGDAALQPSGIVRTERLCKWLDFDEKKGVITVQAGMTLAQLYAIIVPRGWWLPVVPGTRFVSVGGCLASNVHGKNQWRDGEFAEHVVSARLVLPKGDVKDISPRTQPALFWATAGGMGMTGILESVTLKLTPLPSLDMHVESQRVDDLAGMVTAFQNAPAHAEYRVGWINHLRGEGLSGVFHAGWHLSTTHGGRGLDRWKTPGPGFPLARLLPSWALNGWSMARYNARYQDRFGREVQAYRQDLLSFFHPLDRWAGWNRLYGRSGLIQYQCVLPDHPDVAEHLEELLRMAALHGHRARLVVVKQHRASKALMGFSIPGYSLAMDFANRQGLFDLLHSLSARVAARGGRAYLAKDVCLQRESFRVMYSNGLQAWQNILGSIDPQGRMRSLMAFRLGFHPGEAS